MNNEDPMIVLSPPSPLKIQQKNQLEYIVID